MDTKALLLELLISGFFAIACFRARANTSATKVALRPRDLFKMTDRVERLSRSRWQWFAMAGILILVRLQSGAPLVAELTAALQFLVFLALPTQRSMTQRAALTAADRAAARIRPPRESRANGARQRRTATATASR